MGLGRLMRAVCLTSGAAVLIGGVVAICVGLERLRRGASDAALRSGQPARDATVRRDYFRIRRLKGGAGQACWMLHGFGRYECALEFATWEEAMNQARYRLETLGTGEAELRFTTNLQ
jgi:hypothetical protein